MPHGKGTYGNKVGRPRKQKSAGGKLLANLISRKYKLERELATENMSQANQKKTSKDIDNLQKRIQKKIDDGNAYEAQTSLQSEMSDLASQLKARNFSDDRIDELLEEVFEHRNYSGLEEALSRTPKQEGGPMSIDNQMKAALIIPMEEKEDMSMESDNDMEDNYTRFIMDEALTEDEEDMLTSKLEQDEELAMLFDKVIDVAQEFAGSGPVDGPGSGVSDSIPARLSDGEFVFTAKATEEIGADELMRMMKDAEVAADERQELAIGGEPLSEEEKILEGVETSDSQRVARKISDNMLDPYTQDRYVRS